MHRFSVWAPRAGRVDLVLTAPARLGRRLPMTPAAGTATWDGRASTSEAGHGTDYAFSLDGGRPAARPAQRLAAAGRARPQPGVRRRPGTPGRTPAGRAGRPRRARSTSCTSARSPRRAPWTPPSSGSTTSSTSASTWSSSCRSPRSTGAGAGATTGSTSYAVHDAVRRPGRRCSASSTPCHGRGLGVCLDVVYNHLGPSGQLPRRVRPVLHRQARHPLGRRGQPRRRRAPSTCGAGSSTTPCAGSRDFHVDALRLDAVHALRRRLRPAPARAAVRRDRRARRRGSAGRSSLVAESDLNDPRMVEPTADGGLGMTAQWSDDLHHALHSTLTGETQGYYVDFEGVDVDRAGTLDRRCSGTPATSRRSAAGRGARPSTRRAIAGTASSATCRTTTRSATAPSATASAPRSSRPGARRRARRSYLTVAVHADGLHGRGVGGLDAVAVLHRLPRPRPRRRRCATAAGREFAEHGWDAEDVPDPQDPVDPSTRACSTGPSRARTPHARMLAWYRALVALAQGGARPAATTTCGASRVDTGPGRPRVHRGAFRVLVNLGPGPAEFEVPDGAEVVLAWTPPEPVPGGLRVAPDDVAIVRT